MLDTFSNFLDETATGTSSADVIQPDMPKTLQPITATMPNALELFYNNLEVLGYNLEEMKPALECQTSALIISCAGSGKTTFLVFKLIRDYLAGDLKEFVQVNTNTGLVDQQRTARVLISTFLKTGATELKAAFDRQCKALDVRGITSDTFTFSTLHAEYYAILKDLGIKIDIQSDEDSIQTLTKVANAFSIRSKQANSYKITREGVNDLQGVLTYARNRIDGSRYKHALMEEYNLTPQLLEKVLERCKLYRKAASVYDFEDLQELIYEGILSNPAFAKMIGSRYSYIFIDEFQDTSQIQYEILKVYINNAKKTIAIGDDDQCIYSWRGSDNNIITHQFESDYHPTIHKFTVNYRCRANILAPVISSISRNTGRHDKALRAYKPGGSVTIRYTDAVDDLLSEVQQGIASGYTVGILSRTNFDLLAPAMLLELDGSVPFTVSKSVGISGYIPKQVLGSIKLLTRRYTEDFESLLKLFTDRYSQRQATTLADILKTQRDLSLSNIAEEDLAYSCPMLYRNLIKPIREAADQKAAYIYILKYLRDYVYTGTSAFALRARLFCSFICDLVISHTRVKSLDLDDIDELFTDIIPTRLNKRAWRKDKDEARVKLTTVHEAKGKEWQSVIIWNDTDGVFPAVISNHVLTQAEFEEERRLHYIAFTRAKECLTIFTSRTKPSPFLAECAFDAVADAVSTNNIHEELPELKTKQGIIPQQTFDTEFDLACQSKDVDVATDALNLLAYYNYDRNKAIERIFTMYSKICNQLCDTTDFHQNFVMTLTAVIADIMNTTASAEISGVT